MRLVIPMRKTFMMLAAIFILQLEAESQDNMRIIEEFSEDSQQENGINGWEENSFLGDTQ